MRPMRFGVSGILCRESTYCLVMMIVLVIFTLFYIDLTLHNESDTSDRL
jgi:preprotein translocase subunit SecY